MNIIADPQTADEVVRSLAKAHALVRMNGRQDVLCMDSFEGGMIQCWPWDMNEGRTGAPRYFIITDVTSIDVIAR